VQVNDWPLEQKLIGERDTLGHYLSGHPLDPWRSELVNLVGFDLSQCEKIWGEKKNHRGEAALVVAGLVTSVRRRGENMAIVQIEDGHGQLEVTFFREAFQQYGALATRDRIMVIEGGLAEDHFSGGMSLRARQCWDFKTLCSQQGRRLSISADLRQAGTWEGMQQIMAAYRPGGTPLRMELRTDTSQGTLDLNGPNSVRSEPELISSLRALPGISSVALTLHKPWLAVN